MKITLRIAALACAAFVLMSVANQASAGLLNIQIGTPPPPPQRDYNQWQRPGPGAVWIRGHNEWIDGHWVWVGGHYEYPPRPGGRWVPGHYSNSTGQWRPGHWDY